MRNRDFNDPQYIKWRKGVFKRDSFKCKMPNCSGKKLEAHHIVRWADNPLLRYEISNGITLCKYHHKLVTGQENDYVVYFKGLLTGEDIQTDLYFDLMRQLDELKDKE